MSFTLEFSTQQLNAAYNEVVYVTSETLADELTGFESVGDIKVNGTSIANMKIQPNPSGFSIFDIHRIVESELSHDLDPTDTDIFRLSPNSLKRFQVLFTGEGDAANSIAVTNSGGFMRVSTNIPVSTILNIGDTVTIVDSSVAGYNNTFAVTSFPTSTSMLLDGAYISATFSGDGNLIKGDGTRWELTGGNAIEAYLFNGVIDWVDFPTFDGDDYIYGGATNKLLTSIDNTNVFQIDCDSYMYLNGYQGKSDGHITNITIVSDNGTFQETNTFTASTNANLGIQVNISPKDLQTNSTISVISGSLPVLDTLSTGYTVTVNYSTGDPITYTFELIDYCSRFDKYNFVFLDKFGSFIPVTFNLMSKTNKKIDKKTYNKNYGSFDGSNWGYNTWDRGKTRLNTSITETINVTSDWVNEDMSAFIEMMIESPEVYVEDVNGNFQAINILDTNYTVKSRVNDKLINHTIKFEYSNNNKSQRG